MKYAEHFDFKGSSYHAEAEEYHCYYINKYPERKAAQTELNDGNNYCTNKS